MKMVKRSKDNAAREAGSRGDFEKHRINLHIKVHEESLGHKLLRWIKRLFSQTLKRIKQQTYL